MHHRHLLPGFETTVASVSDVLERGTLADWRELAHQIRDNPSGPLAEAVRKVTEHLNFYGTTILWRDYLERCSRRDGQEPSGD